MPKFLVRWISIFLTLCLLGESVPAAQMGPSTFQPRILIQSPVFSEQALETREIHFTHGDPLVRSVAGPTLEEEAGDLRREMGRRGFLPSAAPADEHITGNSNLTLRGKLLLVMVLLPFTLGFMTASPWVSVLVLSAVFLLAVGLNTDLRAVITAGLGIGALGSTMYSLALWIAGDAVFSFAALGSAFILGGLNVLVLKWFYGYTPPLILWVEWYLRGFLHWHLGNQDLRRRPDLARALGLFIADYASHWKGWNGGNWRKLILSRDRTQPRLYFDYFADSDDRSAEFQNELAAISWKAGTRYRSHSWREWQMFAALWRRWGGFDTPPRTPEEMLFGHLMYLLSTIKGRGALPPSKGAVKNFVQELERDPQRRNLVSQAIRAYPDLPKQTLNLLAALEVQWRLDHPGMAGPWYAYSMGELLKMLLEREGTFPVDAKPLSPRRKGFFNATTLITLGASLLTWYKDTNHRALSLRLQHQSA